jgi:formylmethanofuran dehydrogenase subunit E
MKRYYVQVPREYQLYFSVEAENKKEARFEAQKHIIHKALNDFVPLDITEADEVFPCEMCAANFPQSDLFDLDGKKVCDRCAQIERTGVPEFW